MVSRQGRASSAWACSARTSSTYIQSLRNNIPYNQTGLPLSLLPPNFTGDEVFQVTTPINTNGGKLTGFEINVQQPFSFLPGLLKNSGVLLNYTKVEVASIDYPGLADQHQRHPDDLLNLSPTSWNATLYYDDGTFSARVSASDRSSFLTRVPGQNNNDVEGKNSSLNVDMSMSYKISEQLEVTPGRREPDEPAQRPVHQPRPQQLGGLQRDRARIPARHALQVLMASGRGRRPALSALRIVPMLVLVCAGFAVQAQGADAAGRQPLVLLVGDSTMAPQTGYGDALCRRLEPAAACLNLGRGGRSSLSYRAEGLWDRVRARLSASEPGVEKYVLIQFGHNDQPGKPGRSTDLVSEFPANLARFVSEARADGGTPVLVTPLTRRSFELGALKDDLMPWAETTRRVARELSVPLLDLHAVSAAAVQKMGSEEADTLAQAPPGAPGFDRTHLGERGACVFAELMAAQLRRAVPDLVRALRAGPDCLGVPPATLAPPLKGFSRSLADQPGWAVGTAGGRGGRIERVTTLKADGPGSLRAALAAAGARLVVFEVGGVIDLGGRSIDIRHPFVTLAGQTAPHPGITLIRGGLDIHTHDVIVQHLWCAPVATAGRRAAAATRTACRRTAARTRSSSTTAASRGPPTRTCRSRPAFRWRRRRSLAPRHLARHHLQPQPDL